MGMIMLELTTGCKTFANVEHNVNLIYKIIDGERPEITNDTPECFADLMKKCWDSNPSKRPSILEIYNSAFKWHESSFSYFSIELKETFKQAEIKRLELIQLNKLGPRFRSEERRVGKE